MPRYISKKQLCDLYMQNGSVRIPYVEIPHIFLDVMVNYIYRICLGLCGLYMQN